MDPTERHGSRSRHARSPGLGLSDMPREDGQFDIWFLEFSNAYNLNLHRPNSGFLAPDPLASSYYDDSLFYDRLRIQYHQGNTEHIQALFAKGAWRIHSQWVQKPRAERDVTPSAIHIDPATTETERRSLLEHLGKILDLLDGGMHLPEHRSKRPSAGRTRASPSPKRSRAVANPSRPPSVISRLDSSEVRSSATFPDSPALPAARESQSSKQTGVYDFALSANTSKSSLVSRVFTEAEDAVIPASQDSEVTNIVDIPLLRSRRPSPSVIGSLAPSESTEHALVNSFNEYVDHEHAATEQSADGVSLSHSSSHTNDRDRTIEHPDHPIATTEDSLPDAPLFDTPEVPPLLQDPPQDVHHPKTAITDAKNFPKRLQNVWRE